MRDSSRGFNKYRHTYGRTVRHPATTILIEIITQSGTTEHLRILDTIKDKLRLEEITQPEYTLRIRALHKAIQNTIKTITNIPDIPE